MQEEQEPQTLKLGDGFDPALIGITLTGQFVYSLNKLTELTKKNMSLDTEQAQGYVAHQAMYLMQTHGPNSPVFVDDSIGQSQPSDNWYDSTEQIQDAVKNGTLIYSPDAPEPPKGENVILIPGVTHGRVKGFIAPNELHS